MIIKFKFSLLWAIIIIVLLVLPTENIPESEINFENLDKIAHFLLFSGLGFITYIESKKTSFKNIKIIIISLAFAIFTELLQLIFTTCRQFDFFDIISDILGYFTGFFITKLLYKNRFFKRF